MNLRRNVRQLPLRLAAGTFIINSGLSKWGTDEATAQHLEGFAAGAYPFLAKLDPQLFVKALSVSEVVVGAAVLLPFVPAGVAGAALTAFSAGLIGLYLLNVRHASGRESATHPAGPPAGQGRLVGGHRGVPGHRRPSRMGSPIMTRAQLDPHLRMVRAVVPRTPQGCEECLQTGSPWVHLRLCLTCGHIGCCDSAPNRHARWHAGVLAHPIVQSFEPGENWRWRYIHENSV